ncbi:MAG: hypothetical protein AB7O96_11400, partial [Pseudobdellovibrionaceae bacterium]
VGVGTTAPASKLEVAGGAGITVSSIAPSITFTETDTAADWYNIVQDGGSFNIRYKNNWPAVPFVITNAGNVGIGTTAPAKKLHVYADSGDSTLRVSTNGVNGYIDLDKPVVNGSPAFLRIETDANDNAQPALTINTTKDGGTNPIPDAKSILTVANDGSAKMTILGSGDIGVGTSTPRATLDINGSVAQKPAVSNADANIDFGTGNLQYTADDCQAFNLYYMKDGGSYMFSVQGANSTTCSFTAYSDDGTLPALDVRMPPNHGATTVNKHTIYNMVVMGSTVYVSWIPGY